VTANPLVAAGVEGPPDAWAGVWIAEDIDLISQGLRTGNWIDTSLGVAGAGLDALAFVSDPAGALLQYGVAWIIEHVKPLSEALDWLAGDPAQIAAHARTWRNVAASLHGSAAEAARAVDRDLVGWGGSAGPAYRGRATEQHAAIDGLARAAEAMATITEGAGALIAAVRILVRDAIATCVSRLIVYAAEVVASLGVATPLVVEQVATLVASWAARIARWLKALLASLRRLMPIVRHLGDLIEELKKILSGLRNKNAGDEGLLRRQPPDGITRNGAKILMAMDNIRAMAAKWGIDLQGVRIVINKGRDGLPGITGPDGTIHLSRAAFRSEEELARTLEHERFHVQQVRDGMPYPKRGENTDPWEAPAYAHEKQWWENHPLNQPGGARQ
jgi:hypothetical protein